MLIHTVGDLRQAVKGYGGGLFDVWYEETGHRLVYLGKEPIADAANFAVEHESKLLTIADLLKAVSQFSGKAAIRVWKDYKEVKLNAVGPEGENIDFSFYVVSP